MIVPSKGTWGGAQGPPRPPLSPEDQAKIVALREKYPKRPERLTVKYRIAITKQIREGATNKQAAGWCNVAESTYCARKSCKEGQVFVKAIKAIFSDPNKLAEYELRDDMHYTAAHLIEMRDLLAENGDYEAALKADFKILENFGFFKNTKIDINLPENMTVFLAGHTRETLLADPIHETSYKLLSDSSNSSNRTT